MDDLEQIDRVVEVVLDELEIGDFDACYPDIPIGREGEGNVSIISRQELYGRARYETASGSSMSVYVLASQKGSTVVPAYKDGGQKILVCSWYGDYAWWADQSRIEIVKIYDPPRPTLRRLWEWYAQKTKRAKDGKDRPRLRHGRKNEG